MIFEFEGGGPFDGDRRDLPLDQVPPWITYPCPISRKRPPGPGDPIHVYRYERGRIYVYQGVQTA